ncbi:N-lysine methyltransferase KMT5A isoform X2 [Numida meleagris]|uniref:N-lysine methyltransferase KMT5A isoform X2 n=1 Tax=Numida meleagris TaxID=8996 RepID=UPI000B3E2A91|nr:N-lysine methyltransferase KMT5A isoform X2 [Numida meleagris]
MGADAGPVGTGLPAARRSIPRGPGRRGRRDSSPARCAQLVGKGLGRRGSPCRSEPFKHGAGRGGREMTAGGGAEHGSEAVLPSSLLGRNMPKARAGGAEKASPENAERKSPGRARAGGENAFTGQSKIYSYLNPNKTSGARSPLQEENSVMYHEVKCQGKMLTETNRKGDEKKNGGNIIEGAMKPEEQKDKESGCNTSVVSSDQKNQGTVETEKTLLPSDCAGEASAKPAQKKMVKAKRGPRRKTQGRAPNRKVTDYYPVRRSSRKSKSELETEERRKIDELITSGKEEGMKIDYIDGKGRGVIATKHFNRGEFVVEYHGDLLEITDAKKREAVYAQDPSTGCYMYYFQYLSKTYCVDATKETNRLGRLINHSKCGNCQTKLHDIDGVPHLILIASRDIKAGEELLYDYGDRSKASIEAHPWLKH